MAQSDIAFQFVKMITALNCHQEFALTPKNHDEIQALKRRLRDVELLKEKFEKFTDDCGTNSIIVPTEINDEETEVEYQFQDTTEKFYQVINLFDKLVDKNIEAPRPLSCSSHANQAIHVKLPTIELPKFTGCFTEWASFFDTFTSLIDNNDSLTNTQKLHYLKACLHDEPKTALDSLKPNDENYLVAIELLKQRYENKRLIINNHLNNIFTLPNIVKSEHKILREFLDKIKINLSTLKALGRPVEQWSDLLVYIIISKLDHFSCTAWEESIESNTVPNYQDLITFLNKRCQTLESVQIHKVSREAQQNSNISKNKFSNLPPFKKRVLHVTRSSVEKKLYAPCFICHNSHNIFNCPDFIKISPNDRLQQIKSMNRCTNCFRKDHFTKDCALAGCRRCGKKHHSLLHNDNQNVPRINEIPNNNTDEINPLEGTSQCNLAITSNVLLSTAVIRIKNSAGVIKECRALLDIGSQSHFITEQLCNFLNLKIMDTKMSIIGINSQVKLNKFTDVTIQSRISKFQTNIKCLIISKITEKLPSYNFNIHQFNLPKNLKLADPTFNISSPVDMLIGAELFLDLLLEGKIKMGKNQPILQNTVLGWILGGAFTNSGSDASHCYKINLDNSLTRFWELENVQGIPTDNKGLCQNACEIHFQETTTRLKDGRFMVRLPFKKNPPNLGKSRDMALKRLYNMERKFLRDPKLKQEYSKFMVDYLKLGHMELVADDSSNASFYLPHSCVINPNSISTKLRVVFDGSCKSSNNLSLNDNLLAGPVLQPNLFSILIQFRLPRYVITTDISKMYRSIVIHPEDRKFQKILWRESPELEISTYELNTVTYGLTPSSYQAIKCIQQLGIEERPNYPLAHDILMNCFYVDDALFGADTPLELIKMKEELKTVLLKGGFQLSKWSSNCIQAINHERDIASVNCLIISKDQHNKTLGIRWQDNTDTLLFTNFEFLSTKITKRSVLSTIAQLFDPLGLINPVITQAKLIMQQLWAAKINWDEEIPIEINKKWMTFLRALPQINQIEFPRRVICSNSIRTEIHGFCDSSEKAYGAVLFVRSIDEQLNVHLNLLCAKSRVAPLKTISLPRLELCGALLLAQLSAEISKTLPISPENYYFWTDSKIVLSWLAAEPNNWKTFIANRVSEIQVLTAAGQWNHVKGCENPSDIITRGASPSELRNHSPWFNGPAFLKELDFANLNKINNDKEFLSADVESLLERRYVKLCNIEEDKISRIFHNFSSYCKLKTAIAWWRRFIKNLRNKIHKEPTTKGKLTLRELRDAHICIVKLVQGEAFYAEIRQLKTNHKVSSSIEALNPFLDEDHLIRVGGRLCNAPSISYNHKYPILLPKHHITKLIIRETHELLLHVGCAATLAHLRLNYWPLSGRAQVRKIIHNCMNCFKSNPKPFTQLLGNLPEARISQARPFLRIGVDFGGPILTRQAKGRGQKTQKSYICLFVCLCTKAVHVELVSDLTSIAFINALKRLISRRGNVELILSDNATNFVGAKRELKNILIGEEFQNQLRQNHLKWQFIPPRAPHFGGLWEAGIKSVKTHIKRVIGEQILTFEEMYTLLVRIEAVLNSRPLNPLSEDPHDLTALTPGHFLIGCPLTAPVEQDHSAIPVNRLSRWQLIEACRQHFWQRWSAEYLSTLQSRAKWRKKSNVSPVIDELVLIKEDNLPPLQWQLGRISAVHPGKDGLVRVVSVRVKNGVIKRSISKLCPLPKSEEN